MSEPNPCCEICLGEGIIEEHESFQNAWGEHGLETWYCECTESPTPEGEKEDE